MILTNVTKVVTSLEKFTARLLQKVTLNITANLQETTPVDTGWARANWVPSISNPYRGLDTKVTDVPSEKGKAEVATKYTLDKGAIFISNNVPYIKKLNEGSSKQAPAAFIQAAIIKGVKQSE